MRWGPSDLEIRELVPEFVDPRAIAQWRVALLEKLRELVRKFPEIRGPSLVEVAILDAALAQRAIESLAGLLMADRK